VRGRKLKLRYSFWRRSLRAVMLRDPYTLLEHSGSVHRGEGSLYLVLRGGRRHETLLLVLHDPRHPNFVVTSGVIAGTNLAGNPVAGPVLMSRRELHEEDAKTLLPSKPFITVPPLADMLHPKLQYPLV
jgi:hypothetical protein